MTKNFLSNAIHEVERRNQIRRDADLPMLSPAVEVRKLKQAKDAAALDAYELEHGAAVKEQVLARRKLTGKRLSWMIGMAIANDVRKILKEQLRGSKSVRA